jgi:hypothetical protein
MQQMEPTEQTAAVARRIDDLAHGRRHVQPIELESAQGGGEDRDSVRVSQGRVHDDERSPANPAEPAAPLEQARAEGCGAHDDTHSGC